MNSELKSLECSIGNNPHFLVKPVTLLCGHAFCFKCIESFNTLCKIKKIKCDKCNKEHTIDLDLIAESTIASNLISKNLNDVFEEIRNRFELLFSQFKHNVKMSLDNFDFVLANAKEEVDIKVESVKKEIDVLGESIKNSMGNLKLDFVNSIELKFEGKFQNCFKQLNQRDKNENALEDLQQNLKNLNETVKYLTVLKPQPIFKASNKRLKDKSFIGSVESNFNHLLKKMDFESYEIIDQDYELHSLCWLEEPNYLIAASSKNHSLTIFDDRFNITNEIHDFDGEIIVPRYIATNGRDKIYIVQSGYNKITVTDFKFKKLNEFGGTKGSETNQLECPLGICYYNDSIYICDSKNKRIQKLSQELVFEDSFPLEFLPWEIKISNNYMCIRPNEYENIFFFNLCPFKLIKFVSNGNGVILNSKYWFYVLTMDKMLTCYDLCGQLVDRIFVKALKNVDISDGQVALECLENENLIISCKFNKKLIRIN